MADFGRHFQDPRYIRVQGRPLLMIYRPRLIPDTAETIARWRAMFQEQFDEDPIIIMAQSFNDSDPRVVRARWRDRVPAAQADGRRCRRSPTASRSSTPSSTARSISYDDVVRVSLEEPPPPSFPLIKTAVPSWDNDARRQGTGLTLIGSTPAKYENWLTS